MSNSPVGFSYQLDSSDHAVFVVYSVLLHLRPFDFYEIELSRTL